MSVNDKRRRDQIKAGYQSLEKICVRIKKQPDGFKLSHAEVLSQTVQVVDELETELQFLRDEEMKLQTKKSTIDMVKHYYTMMSLRREKEYFDVTQGLCNYDVIVVMVAV